MMFEMTRDGCMQATEYLKFIGKYTDFINNRTSVDGYSLIAYANSLQEADDD